MYNKRYNKSALSKKISKREKAMTKLRKIRKEKKLKMIELAGKSGVIYYRLSFIENGYVPPSKNEANKIAKVLKMKVSEIFPGVFNDEEL